MRFSRKKFVAAPAAVAAASLIRYPADAAEFVYKYANDNPLTHPMGQNALWWAEKVRRDSGGRMEIQVFPASVLGNDPSMLNQLRIGGINFLHLAGSIISSIAPGAAIADVAFAFKKFDDPWKALDGELGAYMRAEIDKTGIHTFNRIYDAGFRVLTNSVRPLTTPADLKGLKFRTPESKIVVSMIQAFGATAVPLSIGEVYTALQTHIVDGTENDLINIEANKLYEVQKYCSMTQQRWAGFWLLANGESWAKLPKNLQDIVSHAYDQSVDRERSDSIKLQASLQPKLESQGVAFNSPDIAPFRNVLKASGYYTYWRNAFGDQVWRLLEKYTGNLT